MKGIVFTELLAMAEGAVGEAALDEVLDGLELESGGAYSRVGNYPCSELVSIFGALSARTGISGEELQRRFGAWMLRRFLALYPDFFEGKAGALEMLDAIEGEVHVEVRKLYPDAELPRFETKWSGQDRLSMRYASPRPLVAFCGGLISECAVYFGDNLNVEVTQTAPGEAVFDIERRRVGDG